MQTPVNERAVLTIAGSDSCGGAGIQADLSTFTAFGVYGASVITAVLARNTLGVRAVERISDRLIVAQLESVLDDLPVRAIKTGMLPSVAAIAILAGRLQRQVPRIPLVVDPVVVEPVGGRLGGGTVLAAIQSHLFPLATVITPDLEEAEGLTGIKISRLDDMEAAAAILLERGPTAVLLKGGRFDGEHIDDVLVTRDGLQRFTHRAFGGRFHGTGCALSAAVAAALALGRSLPEAVGDAVNYVQCCLEHSVAPATGRPALLGHRPLIGLR